MANGHVPIPYAGKKWGAPTVQAITDYSAEVQKRQNYRQRKFNASWKSNYYKQLFDICLNAGSPYPERGYYDFGRWFNYYWAELERTRFVEQLWPPFSVVFDLEGMLQRGTKLGPGTAWNDNPVGPVDLSKSYYLRPGAASGGLLVREEFERSLTMAPQVGRQVLMTIFQLGFEELPQNSPLRKDSTELFHGNICIPNFNDGTVRGNASNVNLAYRGEARTPDKVEQQQGAKAKADIDGLVRGLNMNAPWHPYSEPTVRGKMWMRRFSRDHDYETILSISQDFSTACAYPMVKLREGFEGRCADWSVDKRRACKNAYTDVNLTYALAKDKQGKTELLIGTASYLYVLNVKGKVTIDTMNYKGALQTVSDYNERGIRSVDLKDIIAVFFCRRLHHPVDAPMRFNSTMATCPTTVTFEKWLPLLRGIGNTGMNREQAAKLERQFDDFFSKYRKGFDVGHSGGLSSSPSWTLVEWDTSAWQQANSPSSMRQNLGQTEFQRIQKMFGNK
jgi:hypothetical protein